MGFYTWRDVRHPCLRRVCVSKPDALSSKIKPKISFPWVGSCLHGFTKGYERYSHDPSDKVTQCPKQVQ